MIFKISFLSPTHSVAFTRTEDKKLCIFSSSFSTSHPKPAYKNLPFLITYRLKFASLIIIKTRTIAPNPLKTPA